MTQVKSRLTRREDHVVLLDRYFLCILSCAARAMVKVTHGTHIFRGRRGKRSFKDLTAEGPGLDKMAVAVSQLGKRSFCNEAVLQ